MYNSSSLRSRCNRRKRLFSSKHLERSSSIPELSHMPYTLSSWSSQVTLQRTQRLYRTPLNRSSTPVWYIANDELDSECQARNGKLIMKIHNEDKTYKTVVIDNEIRVGQICEIMFDKNHQTDSVVHWQLYEELGNFPGFERQIEDHEFAMDLQRQWPAAPSRFWFRYNPRKYTIKDNLNQNQLNHRSDVEVNRELLFKDLAFPGISEGIVMLKRPQVKWTKVLCFFVMTSIFFIRAFFGRSKKKAKYLLDLTSMDVYMPNVQTNLSTTLNAPTPHTLLLVPSSIGLLDPEALFAIAVKSHDSLLAWAEGLRYHKYGIRRLSENLENALNMSYRGNHQVNHEDGPLDGAPESTSLVDRNSRYQRIQDTSSGVYESVDMFEGIIFKSGIPYLLLELEGGLRTFSIEILHDRSFDEKRYKLPLHSERFHTLGDLCAFYEARRYLLLEHSSNLTNQSISRLHVDSATAF